MKILFIYSISDPLGVDKPLRSPAQMQFGLSYISSFLKQHGYETRLIVMSKRFEQESIAKLREAISDFKPDIVGFSAVAMEYPFMASSAARVKKDNPELFLIVGGPHPSLNPEVAIADSFDAVCIGEGEFPMLELARALERGDRPTGISNLWIRQGEQVERNPTRLFIQDLDIFPFPDRQVWRGWIRERPGALYSVLLGRGCPYQCTYCSNHALRKLAPGRYVRYRSPKSIVSEIEEIAQSHTDVGTIYLEIETIGANKIFANDLCQRLEIFNAARLTPISFGVNLRVVQQADFTALFLMFKRGGVNFVNIGLESGSERIRKGVLRRTYGNDDVTRVVGQAHAVGLKVCFYNMVGLPDETMEDFQETVAVNRACQPDWHFTSIFSPYPGTDLYALCKSRGYLDGTGSSDSERTQSVLNMPGFSRAKIRQCYSLFDYYVYRGHRPLHLIVMKVMLAFLRTSSAGREIIRRADNSGFLNRARSHLRGLFRSSRTVGKSQ